MPVRDYTVLAEQPLSVAAARSEAARDAIVVSAVIDPQGQSVIISRYGDSVWELWPFFDQANVQPARKRVEWGKIPSQFRDSCKAVLYRYWMVGVPGFTRPVASTIVRISVAMQGVTRYLNKMALRGFSQVQPIHLTNFLHERRQSGRKTSGLEKQCAAIELLYRFRDEHDDRLQFQPWPHESVAEVIGATVETASTRAAKTELIPKEILAVLYTHAEKVVASAPALLDERDAGSRSAVNDDAALLEVRNACFFLMGVLTGMRSDEIAGIQISAGRSETKNGITYHWVRSIEHKTKKGHVEYLMPEAGLAILQIMERWSEPLRARLQRKVSELEADTSADGMHKRLRHLARARADQPRLFLTTARGRAGVSTMSGIGWHKTMRKFAKAAGCNWSLAPHQFRRTYAWTFARHRLGNLLFLKEQLKHSTLPMTQLYTANPQQDPGLYDDMLDEVKAVKVDLIGQWLNPDTLLSGGAGRKIMVLRAHAFDNRRELVEQTAGAVNIRSTGHSFCLAQDDGCGGAGLYERTRCAGCSDGCIDSSQAEVWQEVHDHQRELLTEAIQWGPGAQQRVERDYKIAVKVLTELGMPPREAA